MEQNYFGKHNLSPKTTKPILRSKHKILNFYTSLVTFYFFTLFKTLFFNKYF